MNFHKSKTSKISLVLLIVLTTTFVAFAQVKPQNTKATIIYSSDQNAKMPIVTRTNLYCAGYIQTSSIDTKLEIVGSKDEKEKHIYAEGDMLYINSGAVDGVKVGDMYSVIRPRGKVKTKWTKKKGLGKYVQEVGAVKVIKVMQDVSVAEVKTSCGVMLFGDLLKPIPSRTSPMFVKRKPLDLFAMSSGKSSGRIVMARGNAELLGREMVVYLDLGREDNVEVGDYMTIFRPLGTGDIYTKVLKETVVNNERAYESDRYRGGTFSNQTARKKGANATGKVVTTENAKKRRPKNLRRVVGELVVINVLEKTATAVIVRNASEIHTGDKVELQ